MNNVYDNILGLIGNTPMVRLNKVVEDNPAKVFAKLESYNPGHSVKDRIALHIIETAEKKGILTKGATIVETTSGNTGFSVAMISALRGYKCILAVSDKTKPEKIAFLKSLGATVYVCPASVPADDPRSYYEVAKRITAETPNSVYINQYFNELNIEAHYLTTGKEIWEQTEGKITHLFGCTGTGGTLSGSAKYIKEQNPDVKIVAVEPTDSPVLSNGKPGPHKIQGLGAGFIPDTLDTNIYDEVIQVTNDDAFATSQAFGHTEGILVGISSGAALWAAQELAKRPENKGKNIVVILPDTGERYLSTALFPEV